MWRRARPTVILNHVPVAVVPAEGAHDGATHHGQPHAQRGSLVAVQVAELLAVRPRHHEDVARRDGHDVEERQDARRVEDEEAVGRDGFVVGISGYEAAARRWVGGGDCAEGTRWFRVGHCDQTMGGSQGDCQKKWCKSCLCASCPQILRLCYRKVRLLCMTW